MTKPNRLLAGQLLQLWDLMKQGRKTRRSALAQITLREMVVQLNGLGMVESAVMHTIAPEPWAYELAAKPDREDRPRRGKRLCRHVWLMDPSGIGKSCHKCGAYK